MDKFFTFIDKVIQRYSKRPDPVYEDEFEDEMKKTLESLDNSKDYTFINKTKLLFDLLKESSDMMLLTHKAGLDNQIYDLFYDIYPVRKEDEKALGKYYKPFRTAGVFKIIIQWITSGMKESSLEMAHILANIMDNCNADY